MKSEIYYEDSEHDSDVLNSLYECRLVLKKMGCSIKKKKGKVYFTNVSGFIRSNGKLIILAPEGCGKAEIRSIIHDVCKNICDCGDNTKHFKECSLCGNELAAIEESVLKLFDSSKNNHGVPAEFKKVKYVIDFLRKRRYVEICTKDSDVLYRNLKSIDNIEFNENWTPEMILLYRLCLVLVCNYKIADILGLSFTDVLLPPSSFLFERFVYNRIKECLEPDYVVRPQKYHEYIQKAPDNNPVGIRPDITVYRDSKIVLVVDSKYKKFDHDRSYHDLHQISTYTSVLRTGLGVLVYPPCKNKDNFEDHIDANGIGFYRLGLDKNTIDIFCNGIEGYLASKDDDYDIDRVRLGEMI